MNQISIVEKLNITGNLEDSEFKALLETKEDTQTDFYLKRQIKSAGKYMEAKSICAV